MTEAEILARIRSVRGSTSEVDYPGLADEYGAALIAAQGRADAIAQRNAERAERDRAALAEAVRLCSHTLPPEWPAKERAQAVQRRICWKLPLYGLSRKPSVSTVLALIRASSGDDRTACDDAPSSLRSTP